jgi:hypothetical protein
MRGTKSTEKSPRRKVARLQLQLMPRRRAHPSEKLVHAERLRYIIVRIQIERLNLPGLVPAA